MRWRRIAMGVGVTIGVGAVLLGAPAVDGQAANPGAAPAPIASAPPPQAASLRLPPHLEGSLPPGLAFGPGEATPTLQDLLNVTPAYTVTEPAPHHRRQRGSTPPASH